MAAIGQPKLMRFYEEIFEKYSLKTAQCLMTYRDFENDNSKENTKSTLLKLLEHGYIPIVNENDTVAVEEILLGDNDKLSALVASVIDAGILIIASDIDGLYDSNPHLNSDARLIEEVSDLDIVKNFVADKCGGQGTGGMSSKIEAARICQKSKVSMWIVNGGVNNFIVKALTNKILFTKFKI
jgi:glutamate 5-kinase